VVRRGKIPARKDSRRWRRAAARYGAEQHAPAAPALRYRAANAPAREALLPPVHRSVTPDSSSHLLLPAAAALPPCRCRAPLLPPPPRLFSPPPRLPPRALIFRLRRASIFTFFAAAATFSMLRRVSSRRRRRHVAVRHRHVMSADSLCWRTHDRRAATMTPPPPRYAAASRIGMTRATPRYDDARVESPPRLSATPSSRYYALTLMPELPDVIFR